MLSKSRENSKTINELKNKENYYSSHISVRDHSEETYAISLTTENKDILTQRIDNLNQKKKEFIEKLYNNLEYMSSLKSMILKERNNLNKIQERLNITKDNSQNLQLTSKCLQQNFIEHSKKTYRLFSLSKDLKEEVHLMNGLIYSQSKNVGNLTTEISKQKQELLKEKEKVKDKAFSLEKDNKMKKDNIKESILQLEKMKKSKISTETHYFRLILGLDLIKR